MARIARVAILAGDGDLGALGALRAMRAAQFEPLLCGPREEQGGPCRADADA